MMEGLILNFGSVTTSKFRMFTLNQSSNLAGNFGGAADWLWKNKHRYETLFETHVSKKIVGTSPEIGRLFLDPGCSPLYSSWHPQHPWISPPSSQHPRSSRGPGWSSPRTALVSAASGPSNVRPPWKPWTSCWTSNEQRFTGTSRIWFPYSSQNLAVNVIHRSNLVCFFKKNMMFMFYMDTMDDDKLHKHVNPKCFFCGTPPNHRNQPSGRWPTSPCGSPHLVLDRWHPEEGVCPGNSGTISDYPLVTM